MKNLIKYFPFAAFIALNVLAKGSGFRLNLMLLFILGFAAILGINFVIALILKLKNQFLVSLTISGILATIFTFISTSFAQFFIENVIALLYIGLLGMALIPPLTGKEVFTYQFSKGKYSETIVKSAQFQKINLILNYIWAIFFLSAALLSIANYHENKAINSVLRTLIPIALQVGLGIPITIKLPKYLMQNVEGEQLHFQSIKELFQSMPFGLNREKAKGVESVIQFYLTGKEPTVGFLTIANQKCTYTEDESPNPSTIIRSDSELWLKISNNEISGEKAFLNKQYEIEGDATIMLKFNDLFRPSEKKSKKKVLKKQVTKRFEYKTFAPKKIKNIVVFDGGFRNNKFSKTSFMVNKFTKGAEAAGATVEYFKLKDYEIKDCTGCYSCWTKSPGKCIYNDDMTVLRKKYREADLVIFASPLYIFNVTGIMKRFMDRLLPVLQPY